MVSKLNPEQRSAFKAYLVGRQSGAPYTTPGMPHHEAMCTLIPLGVVNWKQVGDKTFWTLTAAGLQIEEAEFE